MWRAVGPSLRLLEEGQKDSEGENKGSSLLKSKLDNRQVSSSQRIGNFEKLVGNGKQDGGLGSEMISRDAAGGFQAFKNFEKRISRLKLQLIK